MKQKRIQIKYNKTAQYFFYLSNLANWHFSCVPEYNEIWFKKIGNFTTKEKKSLQEFKKILKKYDFDEELTNHYLGKPFIDSPKDKIWIVVKNWVNKNEYRKIREIFFLFNNKLEILWEEDKKKLQRLAKILDKKIALQKTKIVFDILKILFNQKVNNFIIHLFAIPQKSITSTGSANTKKGVVTLELGNKKDIEDSFFIALHEITHHLIRASKLKFDENLIKNKREFFRIPLFKEQGIESAWEEAVLICLLPDGFIKNLLINRTPRQKRKLDIKNKSDFENYLIYQTQKKIKKYFKENKPFDQKFINLVLKKSRKFAQIAK